MNDLIISGGLGSELSERSTGVRIVIPEITGGFHLWKGRTAWKSRNLFYFLACFSPRG